MVALVASDSSAQLSKHNLGTSSDGHDESSSAALYLGINLKGILKFMAKCWDIVADAEPTRGAAFPVTEGELKELTDLLKRAGITDPFQSPVLRVLRDKAIIAAEWALLSPDEPPPLLCEVVRRQAPRAASLSPAAAPLC